MYKNQLQELAQRSCFNLPSYTCIREGPDHAPRFKAVVVFNGESFDSPHFFSTLRQAEHAAAEVALNSLSSRGPSHSLAARILDETGVYKNLLQEISQRVGAPLPQYTTFRSGLGHQPVFTGTVELAGITFTGENAKNKKQAEKNAALAAWASLKQLAQDQSLSASASASASSSEAEQQHTSDEMEQITIARALASYRMREGITNSTPLVPFPQKFSMTSFRPTSPQQNPAPTSKILPLIYPRRSQPVRQQHQRVTADAAATGSWGSESRPHQFLTHVTRPYIPIRNMRRTCHGMAPPVTIRTSVPCYSAPPPGLAPPQPSSKVGGGPLPVTIRTAARCYSAPPVTIRTSVPCHSAPPGSAAPAAPSLKVGGGCSPSAAPPLMRAPPVRISPSVCVAPSVQIRQVIPVHAAPFSSRKDDDPAASLERWMASMRMPLVHSAAPEVTGKRIRSDAVGPQVDLERMVTKECEKAKEGLEKERVELKEEKEKCACEVVEGKGGSERIEEKLEQLNVRRVTERGESS